MTTEITDNIAKLINESFARSTTHADKAKSLAIDAITEAQNCGRLLTKAKEIAGHGQWLTWLTANCPDIGERTAQKYMQLANTNHGADLENATTLRQAYIAAGILPEPESKVSEPSAPKPDEGLLFIQRACQYFNKNDLTKLNDIGRNAWRDRLKPLAELYVRLGGEV